MRRSIAAATCTLGLAALLVGCGTSSTATTDPGIERAGEFVRTYEGDELLAALGYRFAATNPGTDWLLLDLALSAPGGATATVEREDVSIVSPAGTEIPLAEQQVFASAWSELRGDIRRARVMADPLDYFPGGRRPCAIEFFTEPTAGIVFDEVTVDYRRACQGMLFFDVPGSVQTGTWTLRIELEEETVEMPFTIPR